MTGAKRPGVDEESGQVRFDYIKSNLFRVIHVDGIFGGISPNRKIHFSAWNERWPIPKQLSYKLTPEGTRGEEIKEARVSRDAVVREVEVHLIMDVATAKRVHVWLGQKIAIAEKLEEARKAKKVRKVKKAEKE
jgi:hypothetical protein